MDKRHLSKSASELRHRGEGRGNSAQQAAAASTSGTGGDCASSGVTSRTQQQESPSRHGSVIQKTQAFFTSLKVSGGGNRLFLLNGNRTLSSNAHKIFLWSEVKVGAETGGSLTKVFFFTIVMV